MLKDLALVRVTEWYDLGLQLNVDDAELEAIEKDNPGDTKACKRKMFKAWLKTTNPTYEELIDALVVIGEHREADRLSKQYGKWDWGSHCCGNVLDNCNMNANCMCADLTYSVDTCRYYLARKWLI